MKPSSVKWVRAGRVLPSVYFPSGVGSDPSSCGLWFSAPECLRLDHHEVILAEFTLPEGEEDFDEQAVRSASIGDDDRLGGRGIEPLRSAQRRVRAPRGHHHVA